MNLSRRSFMGSILALSIAPAIIKASSLMKVVMPLPEEIIMGFDIAGPAEDRTVVVLSRLLWPGVREVWGEHYAVNAATIRSIERL